MYFETESEIVVQRSSKVTDFGTTRKRVCNILLVINSNIGPILPRFRDITTLHVFCSEQLYPTPIPPELWGVPPGLHSRRRCGSEERRP